MKNSNETVHPSTPGKLLVESLVEHYHENPALRNMSRRNFFEFLVGELNRISGKQWGYKYPMCVHDGTLTNYSKEFMSTLEVLAQSLDGKSIALAKAKKISILVSPDSKVPEWTYFEGDARHCLTCGISFIPNTPTRRRCFVCNPRKRKQGA